MSPQNKIQTIKCNFIIIKPINDLIEFQNLRSSMTHFSFQDAI